MSELRELDIQVAVDTSEPEIGIGMDGDGTDMTVAVEESGGFVVRDYERLDNRPQINGVTLEGNQTATELLLVRRGTKQEWDAQIGYIPAAGQIIVYTDYYGEDKPAMKVGDGQAYLIDLPVTSGDPGGGVEPEDRQFWNNKLNCELVGEELIFNRN